MSIIQKAALRLEELQRAGIAVPRQARPDAQGMDPALQVRLPASLSSVASPAHARPEAQRTSTQVELDLTRLELQGYLVPTQSSSMLAEEFRHIKQPLLRIAREAAGKVANRGALIMVTSALSKEGKTFCAINLALSMAMEIDTTVLLVEADVVRPAVLDRLGLPPSLGLMDILTDPSIGLSEVLLRTNVPKLTLLPAGTRSARSTELLGSDAMERLLVELCTKYPDRVVVFDAPPLLLTAEAKVLAARLGQVVMVVEAGSTSRGAVLEALAAVEECPHVMGVLNKCIEPRAGGRYGQYLG